MSKKTKIQKFIAHSGFCSRRRAEKLIEEKKVLVNDKIAHIGQLLSKDDVVKIDNIKINKKTKFVYYLLNKPRGYISTTIDPKNRKVVTDLVPKDTRIYPVGRLDYNTTGALLLTNDGDLALKLTHPKFKFKKTYIAIVKGKLPKDKLLKISKGLKIDTGYITKPVKLKVLKYDKKSDHSYIRLIISEGKKHQVKMMFKAVGHLVDKLHREAFGDFTVKNIKSGDYVKINQEDIAHLK